MPCGMTTLTGSCYPSALRKTWSMHKCREDGRRDLWRSNGEHGGIWRLPWTGRGAPEPLTGGSGGLGSGPSEPKPMVQPRSVHGRPQPWAAMAATTLTRTAEAVMRPEVSQNFFLSQHMEYIFALIPTNCRMGPVLLYSSFHFPSRFLFAVLYKTCDFGYSLQSK